PPPRCGVASATAAERASFWVDAISPSCPAAGRRSCGRHSQAPAGRPAGRLQPQGQCGPTFRQTQSRGAYCFSPHGQLAASVPPSDVVRQVALFGIQNRDGWDVGLTILVALGNLLPVLPEEETYLALFHGARRVAADCDGQASRRRRVALASRPDL